MVKHPPVVQETWVRSLSWEDPLEKGKAIHYSILAWRIPWTCIAHGVAKSQIRLSDFHSLTSVHDCWKNHSFDYMDLCELSDVSAF